MCAAASRPPGRASPSNRPRRRDRKRAARRCAPAHQGAHLWGAHLRTVVRTLGRGSTLMKTTAISMPWRAKQNAPDAQGAHLRTGVRTCGCAPRGAQASRSKLKQDQCVGARGARCAPCEPWVRTRNFMLPLDFFRAFAARIAQAARKNLRPGLADTSDRERRHVTVFGGEVSEVSEVSDSVSLLFTKPSPASCQRIAKSARA